MATAYIVNLLFYSNDVPAVKIILASFDLSKKAKLPLHGMGCRNIHTRTGSNISNCVDKNRKTSAGITYL